MLKKLETVLNGLSMARVMKGHPGPQRPCQILGDLIPRALTGQPSEGFEQKIVKLSLIFYEDHSGSCVMDQLEVRGETG